MTWETEAISTSPDKCKTLTTECHSPRTEDECHSSGRLCIRLEQRFSAFLVLWPFNNRSSCWGDTPHHKITSLPTMQY